MVVPATESAATAPWRRLARGLAGLVFVAYPVVVWFGLAHGSPRRVALVLLAALLPVTVLRLGGRSARQLGGLVMLPLTMMAALAFGAALDTRGYVLAVPVVINGLLLACFGATLRRDSIPMIERFARLQMPDLPPEHLGWCRTWTVIWCAFFVLNGGTALVLALAAPLAWWALYNGLVAYGLIGTLLALEWVLRRWRFGRARSAHDKGAARRGGHTAEPANDRLTWREPLVSDADGRTIHTFRTRLPDDYTHFAGHFPGYPVLAAAVQLHELVLPCLRRARPEAGALRQLIGVKFPRRIRPGDELEIMLGFAPGSADVEFAIASHGMSCTTGRLRLAPGATGNGT